MAFVSQRIDRSKLVPGDHIYTWRNAFVYAHHGIYIGDGKVVHLIGAVDNPSRGNSWSWCFESNELGLGRTGCPNSPDCGSRKPGSGVMISCLDCFLSNGSLYRFGYGVTRFSFLLQVRSGTCTTVQSDPPKEVIRRALYLHEHGFRDYDIILNNCEHFAMYCKTELVCTLGATGQASAILVPIVMATTYTPLRWLMPAAGPVALTAAAIGSFLVCRLGDNLSSLDSVKKIPVEAVAILRGPAGKCSGSFTLSLPNDQPESAELETNQHLVETESSTLLLTHSPHTADNLATTTVLFDAVEKESTEPVVEGPLVSLIDEIIKGLEKPAVAARANEPAVMEETRRSWAKRLKDDFVNKLVVMDPLVPDQMVSFANSSLKLLSQLPFDVDSLYVSVKNFIVQAYELASAERDVHTRRSDFNALMENTSDRIQALTEEKNRLEKLSSEAEQDLKAIDDQNEAASGSQINPVLKMERECKDSYFQCAKIDLEKTSKELGDISKLMEDLEVTAIFIRDAEKQEISKGLVELEVALGDARAKLLS